MNESWGRRVWHLLTPLILYEGLCLIVESVVSSAWAVKHMENFITSDNNLDQQALIDGLMNFTTKYAILMQGIAALISIVFLYRMYIKDYTKRRFVFDRSAVSRGMWFFLIPTGVFASLAGNLFINIGSAAENSEAFMQNEELLFSGPEIVQIIFIGFVIPVCEELIFRGLIYMRMRQYANVNFAIVISAFIFAVMHGSLLQGIYAFILGIMLSYIYEKFGSLAAPVIVHMSANILSLLLSLAFDKLSLPQSNPALAAGGTAAAIITLLIILFIDKHVQAGRIYLNAEQEQNTNVSD